MEALVNIKEDKCTLCYACIRTCPVKAIRLKAAGKVPEILHNRCIGCGICFENCTFDAINIRDSKPAVRKLLKGKTGIIALVDPSISAEFADITDYRKFVQMIRVMGFREVHEVTFGVDLVARLYLELLSNFRGRYYITSYDPVIVSFIEKYHPRLISNLAPIVSPMVATAKIVRDLYEDIKVVYIGPNIASKDEALRFKGDGKIDAVLSFVELRELFREFNINESTMEYSDFTPPLGFKGSLFPLSNGLLQAADINENVLTTSVLSLEGCKQMIEGVKEFGSDIENIQRHFNITSGNYLMGAGTTKNGNRLSRQIQVIQYVNKRITKFFRIEWDEQIRYYLEKLDLTAKFTDDDQRLPMPGESKIREILKTIKVEDENSNLGCSACGYQSCRDFAVAVAQGLTIPDMCITFSQKNTQDYIQTLKTTNEKLARMQDALKNSEKQAKAEKETAQEASETITAMLQKLRAGVIIIDDKLKVVHCNETFINMLGEDAKDINEVIPGLKGADLKSLVPFNFYNLFTFVLNKNEDIPNHDIQFEERLLNVSVFNIKAGKIIGAVVRDLHQPLVQREEVISRVTEVITKNLEMVQKIGFLLGEGASETERMLNSIIESLISKKDS